MNSVNRDTNKVIGSVNQMAFIWNNNYIGAKIGSDHF
jgi:hypothetical protein